jgi:hypothetical protein
MQPTIGRIVHFESERGPQAAIVTAVNEDGTVDVTVFSGGQRNQCGSHMETHVSGGGPDCDTPTPGCWNWPPRDPVPIFTHKPFPFPAIEFDSPMTRGELGVGYKSVDQAPDPTALAEHLAKDPPPDEPKAIALPIPEYDQT